MSRRFVAGLALAALALPAAARAGGTSENILLIIDPTSKESMYLGNYYKHARNIPDSNILYLNPAPPSTSFAQLAAPGGNIDAVLGHLENSGSDRTTHYIVLAPTDKFFIPAPGHITDGCFPVNRFAISSAYSFAHIRPLILAGGIPSSLGNGYFSASTTVLPAFDSTTTWLGGVSHASGRRFYIGALLGYTGTRGNTVAEIRDMIDRSVSADGTRPAGTFYFMSTTDAARNVRASQFPSISAAITSAGGTAQTINGVLPEGRHDALGILTGWAGPNVDGGDFTILPGAFADHLTSWAATFDNASQTKLSSWIRRGASGSSGTVEEPCAYPGKFPHTILHYFLFRGMSMGEAWFRSSGFVPFQQLFVGDPMTRPFAIIPDVDANLPTGIQSGQIVLNPVATTTSPAGIGSIELWVNGRRLRAQAPGQPFSLKTSSLPDGHHDIRFIAYESSLLKTAGSDGGLIHINNRSAAAMLQASATSGNLSTPFTFTATATPPDGFILAEMRLLHNGRIVAASATSPAQLQVHGRNLGAGPATVRLEAEFKQTIGPARRAAVSAPVQLDIAFDEGVPAASIPIAYSYTRHIKRGTSIVVELPGSTPDGSATWNIISPPSQATISTNAGPYRIITSPPNACGSDPLTFRITTSAGMSQIATVNLIHDSGPRCVADFDGSGHANVDDFTNFINTFAAQDLRADLDGTCTLNIDDFTTFINLFAFGCP